MTTLLWLRQDLRLADNPALSAAAGSDQTVIPVYVWAPEEEGGWEPGAASRWWLHQSLARLQEGFKRLGSRLIVRRARHSLGELKKLARETSATRVVWNRRYEPAIVARDRRIKSALHEAGLDAESFNGGLLREPWEVMNKSGGPFQVFTPFWRHCLGLTDPAEPLKAPRRLRGPKSWPSSATLADLQLEPTIDWAQGMRRAWHPGSAGAARSMRRFLDEAFEDYANGRDRPDRGGTSRLSPHLHFGEISPRQVWHAVRTFALARGQHTTWRHSQFLTEIGWREFAYHLLFHFPQTPEQPLRENYARFPWKSSRKHLSAWQRGRTGYPLIDAGMRQLWSTGWMHNRVRMIVGSFLVKDLLLSWHSGAAWFWDTLVDGDLASNTLGWQWVGGCGADAAPYFRIFNPVTQATRFDPEGTYVREWVPELARLPGEWIQRPWEAPPEVLKAAAVTLGTSYPHRLVDHAQARAQALAALASLTK